MNEIIDASVCTLAMIIGMYALCKGIDIINGCMPHKDNDNAVTDDATSQQRLLDKCNKALKDYEEARGIRKRKYKR